MRSAFISSERMAGGRYIACTGLIPDNLFAWLLSAHRNSLFSVVVQDLDYDAAVPMFVNRKYFVLFLHNRVFAPGHSNILEDFLYITFRSTEYVAMTRANAIVDLLISRPMRWLSGKSSELQEWSPYSMGRVLDIVEQFMLEAQRDGSLFLDPELDLFKNIADEQPLFAEWRHFTFTKDVVLSPGSTVKHLVYKLALDEALQPKDATNASTRVKTIEYLEIQCTAALRKLHDSKLALRDKLTSHVSNCLHSNVTHTFKTGVPLLFCRMASIALEIPRRHTLIRSAASPPTTALLSPSLGRMT